MPGSRSEILPAVWQMEYSRSHGQNEFTQQKSLALPASLSPGQALIQHLEI
jgi:hypothetical protein